MFCKYLCDGKNFHNQPIWFLKLATWIPFLEKSVTFTWKKHVKVKVLWFKTKDSLIFSLPLDTDPNMSTHSKCICIPTSGGVLCSLHRSILGLELLSMLSIQIHVPNPVLVQSDPFQTHVCTVSNLLYKSVRNIVSLRSVPCNWCH